MPNHSVIQSEEPLTLSSKGSTTFHYSFGFLPSEERTAIRTVYAFARRIDDIVDEDPSTDPELVLRKRQRLNTWRDAVEELYNGSATPNSLAWPLYSVVQRYGIPRQYLLTIIDGCERDLLQNRYQTFADLKEYCYGVASVVGLITIEIFGYKREETRQYAINLGYALQLTNILRDVKQDKDRGYIYLPVEDMARFRYTEEDLKNEVYDDRFYRLMQFQAQRARDLYHEARAHLHPEERLTMVAAEIMDAMYYRLLEKIELNDYRVFTQRIRVSGIHKLITAFRIWLGSKLFVKRLR